MKLGLRGGLLLPVLTSCVIILGGLFRRSSLRDAVTGMTPPEAELVLPASYVLLSPLSRLLDAIGLLSAGQHAAAVLTVVALAVFLPAIRTPRASGRRRASAVKSAAIATVVLALLYAAVAALPRPMAGISVSDRSLVVVDFHSHTNASHDTRNSFSPEANRTWHKRGGFDAAYISDHRSFEGAELARSRNPARSGDGVVLLSAYEGRYRGTFQIFLGFTSADSVTLMDRRRWLLNGRLLSGRLPSSVTALSGPLVDVQSAARDSAPYIVAIEITDGSPRGLAQADRDRNVIIRRADSLGLALVSGTNNHGWGWVIPAWTLVTVPNWRQLPPDSLSAAIDAALRTGPRTAVKVVERRRPTLASTLSLPLTLPVAIAETVASLTIAERIVWVVWIWAVWLLARQLQRRRRRAQPAPNLS
ncbi:MAG TPA: hypothetical protein VES88_14840 [Gemmatimonadaceae bacterium]|nr:hypothetical protein [Gemmatimonadaceae bacterium]